MSRVETLAPRSRRIASDAVAFCRLSSDEGFFEFMEAMSIGFISFALHLPFLTPQITDDNRTPRLQNLFQLVSHFESPTFVLNHIAEAKLGLPSPLNFILPWKKATRNPAATKSNHHFVDGSTRVSNTIRFPALAPLIACATHGAGLEYGILQ